MTAMTGPNFGQIVRGGPEWEAEWKKLRPLERYDIRSKVNRGLGVEAARAALALGLVARARTGSRSWGGRVLVAFASFLIGLAALTILNLVGENSSIGQALGNAATDWRLSAFWAAALPLTWVSIYKLDDRLLLLRRNEHRRAASARNVS